MKDHILHGDKVFLVTDLNPTLDTLRDTDFYYCPRYPNHVLMTQYFGGELEEMVADGWYTDHGFLMVALDPACDIKTKKPGEWDYIDEINGNESVLKIHPSDLFYLERFA